MSLSVITFALQQIFSDSISVPLGVEWRQSNSLEDNPTQLPWAYLEVIELSSTRQALGVTANVYERTGIITIQLFSELGKGTKDINDLAEQIRDVYNDLQLAPDSDVQLRVTYPEITHIGKIDDYYQVNVTIPWSANVQKNK